MIDERKSREYYDEWHNHMINSEEAQRSSNHWWNQYLHQQMIINLKNKFGELSGGGRCLDLGAGNAVDSQYWHYSLKRL